MRRLNTAKMRWVIREAARVIKKDRLEMPSDGTMYNILYGQLFGSKGGHWQVELVHDTRMRPKPFISASWWKSFRGGYADYHLTGTLSGRVHSA